ncbi:dimethylarginine dimethylaminohydrolase family protein [Laceyella tengchongensis]|jgi:N-dimethylarginine dimethylaminohydrolase
MATTKSRQREGDFIERSVYCESEYDRLQEVLMCPPAYMSIKEVINHTQQHYFRENIDVARATKQFNEFIEFLVNMSIRVELLSPVPTLPEQVFTRDIGVVIGNRLILSRMEQSIRRGEEKALEAWLRKQVIPFTKVQSGSLEGGDIMIDGHQIWVGVGNRTSPEVVDELQAWFPHHQVSAIAVRPRYLHLDCILNVVAPGVALAYVDAFDIESLATLRRFYRLIEVTEEEQFRLATNVLSLGEGRIISLPQNRRVNEELGKAGLEVYEIDITEITKSGGSFRCITFPLRRGGVFVGD